MFPSINLNNLSLRRFITRLLPLGLMLGLSTLASAQTAITAVPYTISASGKYILSGNLFNTSATVPAITVNAPNVILDLNEFYISGPGNTASINTVILVNNFANVTIKNGTVANDGYGISFVGGTNSRNYIVDGVTVSRCYVVGITIDSSAPGSILRNCSLSNIGNSTFAANVGPSGIATDGGCRIENNTIATVTATGTGNSSGITGATSDFMIGNTVSNCTFGVGGGKYLNNLTSGCTTPFANGIDASGNN